LYGVDDDDRPLCSQLARGTLNDASADTDIRPASGRQADLSQATPGPARPCILASAAARREGVGTALQISPTRSVWRSISVATDAPPPPPVRSRSVIVQSL